VPVERLLPPDVAPNLWMARWMSMDEQGTNRHGGQRWLSWAALPGLVPALRRSRSWTSAVLAILFAIYVGLTGARTAYVQEWGYDLAFRYLRDKVQPEATDDRSESPGGALRLGPIPIGSESP
jgi:hypothetical protein